MACIRVSGDIRCKLISDANNIKEKAPSDNPQQEEIYTHEAISFGRRLKQLFRHIMVRQFVLLCVIAVKIAGLFGRRKRQLIPGQGCDIMLTGRFDSDNWILAHLMPLSASKKCSRIWMVSANNVPAIPKVEAIYISKWLTKILGATTARLLTFFWAAMLKRPHIVGGFHLIANGIVAVITGRLIGAKSIYFCVGGPTEVQNGGVNLESGIFRKMETGDATVERRLLKIVSKFDIIITMGTKAVEFFKKKNINTQYQVLSGGIDSEKFVPSNKNPSVDLILTCRLAEIKRIDIFLQTVKLVADKIPDVKVLIAGDGKLLADLKQMAYELNINSNVYFAGHQSNVEKLLQKSKIFVLTSDSEGLSLSVIEAMMCGLPAIVSDVGDLGDMVEDEVNGFLVPRRCPEKFAARIIELLTNENKLRAFSMAAHKAALKYSTQIAAEKWDYIIENYCF
jgi:glycosyltransferase involved in cell wall biosynthesis